MGAERSRMREVISGTSTLMLLKQQLESWGEQNSAQIAADLMLKEQAGS